MNLITQARTSKCCGQACLAMIAGVTMSEAVQAVGHRRGTKARDIERAAAKLGLTASSRLWTLTSEAPVPGEGFAIVKCRRPRRRNWHWVAIVDGEIADPLGEHARADAIEHAVSFMRFRRSE